jgi:WD40 repeat protein
MYSANVLRIYDTSSGALLSVLQSDRSGGVAWSPDGTKLATGIGLWQGGSSYPVKVWQVRTGALLLTLTGHSRPVTAQWHLDSQRLLTVSQDNTVRIWNVTPGIDYAQRQQTVLQGHVNEIEALDWSPDGSKLVSGSADGSVRIWEARTGSVLLTLTGNEFAVEAVDWSPDGKAIAAGGADNKVYNWSFDPARLPHELVVQGFSPGGEAHGRTLNPGEGNPQGVAAVAWSSQSELASGGYDGQAIIWNFRNTFPRRWMGRADDTATYPGFPNSISGQMYVMLSVAWMPDGRWLMGTGGSVHFWEATSGRLVRQFECNSDGLIIQAVLSPDGRRVAGVDSWSESPETCVWDVQTEQLLANLSTQPFALAFRPGSNRHYPKLGE